MRYLEGLGALERQLTEWGIRCPIAVAIMSEESSKAVEKKVKEIYGDSSKLAALAPSTQADRESLGYTANDPLERTGELLRDSVKRARISETEWAVYSEEEVAFFQEYGYWNARTNSPVPGRPVYHIAAVEALADVDKEVLIALKMLFEAPGG